MLAKAETIWPTGMDWSEKESTTHYYETPGSVVRNLFLGKTNSNYACGGFAAMISDYLFGKSNNPVRKLTDNADVRPGDIIIELYNGNVRHVMIATGTIKYDGSILGVQKADGNNGDEIYWGDGTYWFNPNLTFEIYTRYN